MEDRPALHPDPEEEGILIIYEEHSYKLLIQNGDYIYKKLDWQLQYPRYGAASIVIPDNVSKNWNLKDCLS